MSNSMTAQERILTDRLKIAVSYLDLSPRLWPYELRLP